MKAIIVIDCQNDFSSTGTLPISGGTELATKIYDFINKLDRTKYKLIFSRDWHPTEHISFSNWPVHCVRNTKGAEYIFPLGKISKDLEILKATNKNYDAYSAFYKNRFKSKLYKYLMFNYITDIYVCGLAKDVCVLNTANDGIKYKYNTYILTDLTLSIDESEYAKNIDPEVVEIKSTKLI